MVGQAAAPGTMTAGELRVSSTLHVHELDQDAPSCLGEVQPVMIRGESVKSYRCAATGARIVILAGQSRPWSIDPAYPQVPA